MACPLSFQLNSHQFYTRKQRVQLSISKPLLHSLGTTNSQLLRKHRRKDTTHWVLDMNTFVGEAYDSIREVCIFLINNFTLPPDKALAVYIQSPGSPFLFCGAVTVTRPSAVLSLPWPEPGGQLQLTADSTPISAKIGVSVEDLATLPSLDVAAQQKIERLALKVGENLFNFMQSFCGVDGSKLVVPMDILDRWFKKFQERAKRDPEYLKGFAL
ncbi:hypothetical protein K7X08_017233 [Anisodus acutangulus]|uniref:Hikeshi-like domain-containing protein n=1 Tax=Anisodus acutangulus TaxID=402998 RepID=A0A9Q1LU94_9SOLA|nr:hypothetical protein K7X08_017233 [Anisodus acutangulus]